MQLVVKHCCKVVSYGSGDGDAASALNFIFFLTSSAIFTGKVPVLMVDDTALPQSMAIAGYAAKLAGLVPEDNLDAALCDAINDGLSEYCGEWFKIWSVEGQKACLWSFYDEQMFHYNLNFAILPFL